MAKNQREGGIGTEVKGRLKEFSRFLLVDWRGLILNRPNQLVGGLAGFDLDLT